MNLYPPVRSGAQPTGGPCHHEFFTTNPAEEAFRPMNEGGCPLVRG